MPLSRRQDFSPSCPSGGRFYACTTGTRFAGCCAVDPCNDDGCARGNLYPASFDPAFYGQFPDQECSAGLFYTCVDSTPPFMGCCKSNPCNKGCPSDDLAGAFLSNNPAVAAPWLSGSDGSASSSSGASQTSSSRPPSTSPVQDLSPSTASRVPEVVPTASQTSPSAQGSSAEDGSSTNIGAIVGGVVGAILLLSIVLGLAYWCRKRRRSKPRASPAYTPSPAELPGESPRSFMHGAQEKVRDFDGGATSLPSLPLFYDYQHTSSSSSPYISSDGSPPTTHLSWRYGDVALVYELPGDQQRRAKYEPFRSS